MDVVASSSIVKRSCSTPPDISPILKLPDETLFQILSKLKPQARSIREVCKQFNRVFCKSISGVYLAVLRPTLQELDKSLPSAKFESLRRITIMVGTVDQNSFKMGTLPRYSELEELDLSGIAANDQMVFRFALPKLRAAIICGGNLSEISEVGLCSLLNTSPHLTSLHMRKAAFQGIASINLEKSHGSLISLKLSSPVGEIDWILIHLFQYLPKLRDFELSNTSCLEGSCFPNMVCKLTDLKALSVKFCKGIKAQNVQTLFDLTQKISSLKLIDFLPDQMVNLERCQLGQFIQLTHLALADRQIDGKFLKKILNLSPSLRSLELASSGVTYNAFAHSECGLTNLTRLSIDNGFDLLDEEAGALLRKSPDLRELKLEMCSNIKGTKFGDLTNALGNLRSLELSYLSDLENWGLCQIAQRSRQLTHLSLGRCQKMTDDAIDAFIGKCGGIESLKLEKCNLLTERSFENLGAKLPNLTALQSDSSKITAEGLHHIATAHRLTQLKLPCADLPMSHLVHKLPSLKNLKDLELSNAVTDQTLVQLVEKMPNLISLHLAGDKERRKTTESGQKAALERAQKSGHFLFIF